MLLGCEAGGESERGARDQGCQIVIEKGGLVDTQGVAMILLSVMTRKRN